MKKRTTKTDTVKLQIKVSIVLTITFVLALTLLTAGSILKASSHGSAYCLTQRPASAGLVVSRQQKAPGNSVPQSQRFNL